MTEPTSDIRPRRSVLYMPGSNARALEKAKGLAADSLILDLEDAVAPDAKAEARKLVCEAVAAGGYGPREVVVRVNALDTAWGRDDLAAALAAKPDAVLVPKVSGPSDLTGPREAFAAANADGIALWIMMETPLAMLNARDIAAAAAGAHPVSCMVMGTNDLAKDTGASLDHGRMALIPWLMACLAAARAHGLAIVDGVYNDFSDADGFAAECAQGRSLGMDGKTLIHPGQIDAANAAFSPTEEDVNLARRIIEEFARPENAGKGAIRVDGRMAELLHCETARKTVAVAEAIAARSQP